jgi:hypothetical protein
MTDQGPQIDGKPLTENEKKLIRLFRETIAYGFGEGTWKVTNGKPDFVKAGKTIKFSSGEDGNGGPCPGEA